MRRDRSILLLFICATLPMPVVSSAQRYEGPTRRSPRAWLVLSDGVGPNGGGLSGTTGAVQLFRVSGTVAVTRTLGVEISAERVQELFPALHIVNDPALNSPKADGVFAAVASLLREGPGIPSQASIGAGVVRRPTNDPAKTRLTGAVQVGIESALYHPPVNWADVSTGARVLLMPGGNHHQLYVLALTLGIRLG